jgi:glycosyltransferase involved in cell wall biosynthesis
MRVLVVHNNYSSRVPSGENLAVGDEVAWLRAAGVEVELHAVETDDMVAASVAGQARQALFGVWSPPAKAALARRMREARPDLVHVHNVFPLLTASVLRAATDAGVPVVWTAHNHRVRCVEGGNFRDAAPCTECRPGWRLPGIRHGCYGGSAAASTVVTLGTSIFRLAARRNVTALAISGYVRDWLVAQGGFDPDRVHVKYNGVAGPAGAGSDQAGPTAAESRTFVFVGRLDPHKGIGLLLDGWARTRGRLDARLHIVGDGVQAADVEKAAAGDDRITWFGQVPPSEVAKHQSTARVVVVPARWDEPFGRVAAEAMAHRRGLISTGRGGLAEVADPDSAWTIEPEPAALAAALEDAAGTTAADLDRRVAAGYERYTRLFSPEATTQALISLYEQVIDRRGPAGDEVNEEP